MNLDALLARLAGARWDEASDADLLQNVDQTLAEAVREDMRLYLSRLLSCWGMQRTPGAHGYRERSLLSAFGWINVRFAYVRGASESAFLHAFGVVSKCSATAREQITRCAALCGSFAEARNLLGFLTGLYLSTSKVRALALSRGEQHLIEQKDPPADVRVYPKRALREGETGAAHTFFCMLDGTGVPCTKADTLHTQGKNGDAGTRQIRIAVFGEYDRLNKNGRPVAIPGSFSYAVFDEEISDVSCLIRKLGLARGYGSASRIQCVADGEEALETALRHAFTGTLFTNDFMHACTHLFGCCQNIGLPPDHIQKEYRFLKGLLFRWDAATVIRSIERRFGDQLPQSSVADKELDYLRKRQANMRFGLLRKQGLFIASGHVEAAARMLVVRRCKQTGMHWRHRNALRISAILASLRSAAPPSTK